MLGFLSGIEWGVRPLLTTITLRLELPQGITWIAYAVGICTVANFCNNLIIANQLRRVTFLLEEEDSEELAIEYHEPYNLDVKDD